MSVRPAPVTYGSPRARLSLRVAAVFPLLMAVLGLWALSKSDGDVVFMWTLPPAGVLLAVCLWLGQRWAWQGTFFLALWYVVYPWGALLLSGGLHGGEVVFIVLAVAGLLPTGLTCLLLWLGRSALPPPPRTSDGSESTSDE